MKLADAEILQKTIVANSIWGEDCHPDGQYVEVSVINALFQHAMEGPVRTMPMTPGEFRDAMRKVCFDSSEHPRVNCDLKWLRYQYMIADTDKQLAVSREIDRDLAEMTQPPTNPPSDTDGGG